MIDFKKTITGITSLFLLISGVQPAQAFFKIDGTTSGTPSIYAQGGLLNYDAQNNPYFMLGIEPKKDGVYITQGNTLPFNDLVHPSTKTRLLKINGFGQIQRVGPVLKAGVDAIWGNSLTTGPNNKLYTATNQGVWGFDPKGGSLYRYSQWRDRLTAAGLTFDQNGKRALISGDYSGLVYVSQGAVEQGPPLVGGVGSVEGDPELETITFDDHIVRNDGIYVIGDAERSVAKYTGFGSVKIQYNLDKDKDVEPVIEGPGYGSRGVIDPISGDIFYAITFYRELPRKFYIVRIKKDFSDASVFASDMEQIRDLKFGPSSPKYGNSQSLYVAINDRKTFQGTIYEIPMGKTANSKQSLNASLKTIEPTATPEPSSIFGILAVISLLYFKRGHLHR